MEMAYHELNQREYELTKHVSLLQVDPLALLQLRATGRCTVRLPEALFDMDGPGHYFRRIKTVAVSIPCVTGPYASVNCTLTLLKSSIRKTPVLRDGDYAARGRGGRPLQRLLRQPAVDRHQLGAERQRPVRDQPARRALSAVRELGRDQRVAAGAAGQPEQGRAGAVRLRHDQRRHPAHPLHRARRRRPAAQARGGGLKDVNGGREAVARCGCSRCATSSRHAWAAYKAAAAVDGFRPLKITLTSQHYPFWSQSVADKQVLNAKLIVPGAVKVAKPDGSNPAEAGPFFGEMRIVNLTGDLKPTFAGDWAVGLGADGANDAWLAVQWGAPG